MSQSNVTPIKPQITLHYERSELCTWLREIASQIEADTVTPVAVALMLRREDGEPMVQATGFKDNDAATSYFTRVMKDRLGWA